MLHPAGLGPVVHGLFSMELSGRINPFTPISIFAGIPRQKRGKSRKIVNPIRFNLKKLSNLNDPIYGFITIPNKTIFRLINHAYFQRLRNIQQLGLTNLIYPGANHTRFHHALGAMHLMGRAVQVLKAKGHEITQEEVKGVTIAILLHDIGHGPYSHTLEHSIVENVNHESISALFMDRLNEELDGKLELAIQIFKDEYDKKFLHQLVSGQLDMDRLDYLRRDSFFSGVFEGSVNSERIIKLLNVGPDGKLAVDAKGIYSIEHFLIARRLMYWQVYLHKTVLSAELLLMKILKRAKELADQGVELFATPVFRHFLYNHFSLIDFMADRQVLELFSRLDDHDIMASIKAWTDHDDVVLSTLSKGMVTRRLYKAEMQAGKFDPAYVEELREKAVRRYKITPQEADYFVFTDSVTNNAYDPRAGRINILHKSGEVEDIGQAADLFNISVLSDEVEKHILCYFKNS